MMATIKKSPLPKDARLWAYVKEGDFLDGYATVSALSPRAAADTGLNMPAWASALLKLRNILMKPFGLKTDATDTGNSAIFPVQHEDAREIILGTDDIHLNFRITLLQLDGNIHMATWVHPKNRFGRIYLMAVMPFHVLIVRNAMRQIAKAS